MSRQARLDALTGLLCVLTALALLYLVWAWEPPRPPDRLGPTQTPIVIVVTATPPAVTAGPATTREPLRWQTPLTREPLPTVTPTMEPTPTPRTATPTAAVQRG